MSDGDRRLEWLYGALALVALLVTWHHNLQFFALPDGGGLAGFLRAGFANPAAASLSSDLLFFALAGVAFMLHEGRRAGVRFVWAYVVLSFAVAISVAFPLFLIARGRALARESVA